MLDESGRFFDFPPFRFDLADRVLAINGQSVNLPARAGEILSHLIQNRDRIVSRNELQEKFWADLSVSDNTIDQHIASVRRALKVDPGGERHVETQSKRGWRFIVDVGVPAQPTPEQPGVPPTTNKERKWNGVSLTATAAILLAVFGAVALNVKVSTDKQPRVTGVTQLTFERCGERRSPADRRASHLFFRTRGRRKPDF